MRATVLLVSATLLGGDLILPPPVQGRGFGGRFGAGRPRPRGFGRDFRSRRGFRSRFDFEFGAGYHDYPAYPYGYYPYGYYPYGYYPYGYPYYGGGGFRFRAGFRGRR
jgi:hypothetical protein